MRERRRRGGRLPIGVNSLLVDDCDYSMHTQLLDHRRPAVIYLLACAALRAAFPEVGRAGVQSFVVLVGCHTTSTRLFVAALETI